MARLELQGRHRVRWDIQASARVIALLPASTASSLAGQMTPYRRFGADSSATVLGARYDLARACRAADVVVVGAALDPRAPVPLAQVFQVPPTIEGDAGTPTIGPARRRCQGTECRGLFPSAGRTVLALLRRIHDGPASGRYPKVDGDGGDA